MDVVSFSGTSFNSFGLLPVAIIIFFVSNNCLSTIIEFSDWIVANPCIISTPFFLSKNSTPLVNLRTILSDRFLATCQSKVSAFLSIPPTPNSDTFFILLNILALSIIDLVGIQPQFKHIPPISSFSIIAVFNPTCPALIAATYPAGPEPIMMTSYFIVNSK